MRPTAFIGGIVTREDPLRVFSADLTASATTMTIPSEFFESGTEYKLEVKAIEANGTRRSRRGRSR
jgi:hypothetical protein